MGEFDSFWVAMIITIMSVINGWFGYLMGGIEWAGFYFFSMLLALAFAVWLLLEDEDGK